MMSLYNRVLSNIVVHSLKHCTNRSFSLHELQTTFHQHCFNAYRNARRGLSPSRFNVSVVVSAFVRVASLKGENHGWLYRHVCPSLNPHLFSAKLRRRSCLSSFLCCNKTHLQVDLVSIKKTVFMAICTAIHELYHFLLCNIWLA